MLVGRPVARATGYFGTKGICAKWHTHFDRARYRLIGPPHLKQILRANAIHYETPRQTIVGTPTRANEKPENMRQQK
jgi:hypothetical protein